MDQAVVVGPGALGLYLAGLIVKKLRDEGHDPAPRGNSRDGSVPRSRDQDRVGFDGGAIAGGAIAGGAIAGGAIAGGAIAGGAIAGGAIAGGAIAGGAIAGGVIAGGAIAGGVIAGGAIAGGVIAGGASSFEDLYPRSAVEPRPTPVHLAVRTKVRFPVHFTGELASAQGYPSTISSQEVPPLALNSSDVSVSPVSRLSALCSTNEPFSGVVFVSVPADATAKAVEDVCAWLASARTGQVTLVLCNNGLISNSTRADIARLVEKRPNIFPVRALVYAGFERLFPDENAGGGTEVIHNGGRRIDFGPLHLGKGDDGKGFDSRNGTGEPAEARTPWSDADRATWNNALRTLTPGLEWSYVPDIAKQEYIKFFVNLTLAAHIGPRRMTNSQLAEVLPREQALDVANVYAALRPWLRIDPRELDDALWSTVKATGSNVNSVSLAGFQGRPQLFWFFVSQLNEILRKCPSPDVQDFFKKYLRAAGKLWAQEI